MKSEFSFLKQKAIETDAAPLWKAWRSGPPEAKIVPTSRLLQSTFPFAWRWKWYGRKSIIRFLSRLLGGKEIFLQTHWGGTIVTSWHDTFFSQGVCSEPLETAFVTRLVKFGMTVIDIGANRGWYTILFSKLVGASGKVFAFEPDPQAFKILKRNVEANSFTSNIAIFQQAVSNFSGTANFVIKRDSTVSHLEQSDEKILVNGNRLLKTTCVDLAEFIKNKNLEKVDVVKIDVEGAEMQVLEGFRPLIQRGIRPILLLEIIEKNLRKYNASIGDLMDFFEKIQYVCLPITPRREEFIPKQNSGSSNIKNFIVVSKGIAVNLKEQLFDNENVDRNTNEKESD